MAHLVIIGAGTGGLTAAYELRARLSKQHQVTLINRSEFFEFTPSNPWVVVGWRQRAQISFALRSYVEQAGIQFIAQAVTQIDAKAQTLTLQDQTTLSYDYLLIATGARLAFEAVPGADVNEHGLSICTLSHAEQSAQSYQQLLSSPGPVVIGALPGTSCFVPAYELAFIFDSDLRKRRLRQKIPITLVTSEPFVGHFGLGGVGESATLIEQELAAQQIDWIANARITEVTADGLELSQEDATQSKQLESHLTAIIPAFHGVEIVTAVPGLSNPEGLVLVDDYQRSPAYPNIYAVGTCVAIPAVEETPVPTAAPITGYLIESMVIAAVSNLVAEITGQPATTKARANAICLADMGDTGTALVALPQLPPRQLAWVKKGRWVHMAKIAFEKYFIRKMQKGTLEPIYERYIMKMLGISHTH